jgi:hypothetical protein
MCAHGRCRNANAQNASDNAKSQRSDCFCRNWLSFKRQLEPILITKTQRRQTRCGFPESKRCGCQRARMTQVIRAIATNLLKPEGFSSDGSIGSAASPPTAPSDVQLLGWKPKLWTESSACATRNQMQTLSQPNLLMTKIAMSA